MSEFELNQYQQEPILVRDRLNQIARRFYRAMGCKPRQGFQFHRSQHPQELLCYRLACIAWEEFTGDSPDEENDYVGSFGDDVDD